MSYPVRMPASFGSAPLSRPSVNVPSLISLQPIQARFIEEYLIDLDGRQAAIRAGVPVKDAAGRSRVWMRHELVRDAIGRAMAERSKRVGLNADRVLQRLGALALGDPTSIFNEHGGLKLPSELDEHDRLLIAGVKTRRSISPGVDADGNTVMQPEEIVEVKVIDQLAAINLAMKHLGMLNEKIDVNVTSLADRLREAQLRRAGVLKGDKITIDGEILEDDMENGSATDPGAAGGSIAHDRLEHGGGRISEADWRTVEYADTSTGGGVDTPHDRTAIPQSETLDYDPITGDDVAPAIDWDPLND